MIWSSCREFNILPPGVNNPGQVSWDRLDVLSQAKIIAYHQTADNERLQLAKLGIKQ